MTDDDPELAVWRTVVSMGAVGQHHDADDQESYQRTPVGVAT